MQPCIDGNRWNNLIVCGFLSLPYTQFYSLYSRSKTISDECVGWCDDVWGTSFFLTTSRFTSIQKNCSVGNIDRTLPRIVNLIYRYATMGYCIRISNLLFLSMPKYLSRKCTVNTNRLIFFYPKLVLFALNWSLI